ncbi:putative arabinosyltransferase ARAD1 [Bienertia sinuspersici]
MALKNTPSSSLPCSITSLFLSFSLFCALSFSLILLINRPTSIPNNPTSISQISPHNPINSLKVYIFNLPRSFNYGLLDTYWSLPPDSRIPSDPDHEPGTRKKPGNLQYPPYPENPLIKQYSAEYWLLGDLMTPENLRSGSFAKRVYNENEADVIFVPFFATLSAEIQLSLNRGVFRKKSGNEDYQRQREVVCLSRILRLGKNLVVVIIDEIAPAIILVVDFGGWYRIDAKSSNGNSSERIQHTQVSLLKDVIIPYTHLLPVLRLSEDQPRHTLLYFKGAKHRNRGGVIRAKLWDLLVNEPGVVMEEGFPNATGKEQSIKGMRTSEFCLHPAGDTPTSCRLFDAIQSLCIPVIVSDHIELPFEGMIDYSDYSVIVSVNDALQPKWLVSHLRSISKNQRAKFRKNMARFQPMFVYDNGHPGGIGPIPQNGAVNQIWKKVYQKVPLIKEAIVRDRRKPPGVLIPLRCHCT